MMLRFCVLAATTATAVGLVLGVSPGAAGDHARVISLLSVEQGGNLVDVDQSGGRGPTLGDQYIFTDGLYQWQGTRRGKRVGTTHGIATITSPTTAFFTGTMSLPGGQIQGAGYFSFTAHVETIIVLGGTGRYRDAGGDVTITKLGGENSNNSSLVIRLVR
jgi:Allene oxide cyclase barrel like domain